MPKGKPDQLRCDLIDRRSRASQALCVLVGLVPLTAVVTADTLTNPAAELCKKDGATVVIGTAPNGNQHGVCVFPSGERINEWAYFRNKHRTKY